MRRSYGPHAVVFKLLLGHLDTFQQGDLFSMWWVTSCFTGESGEHTAVSAGNLGLSDSLGRTCGLGDASCVRMPGCEGVTYCYVSKCWRTSAPVIGYWTLGMKLREAKVESKQTFAIS